MSCIQFDDMDQWRHRGDRRAWRVSCGDGLSKELVLELWASDGRHVTVPITGESSALMEVHEAIRTFTPEDWENLPPLTEVLKPIHDAFAEACKERHEKIANHPDNGKAGWWLVDGIRNSAYVRASSAEEAIRKAEDADAVQDWEQPTANFHAAELGDVISC